MAKWTYTGTNSKGETVGPFTGSKEIYHGGFTDSGVYASATGHIQLHRGYRWTREPAKPRTHKVCKECNQRLPMEAFHKNGLRRRARCKPCSRITEYLPNRERLMEYQRRLRANLTHGEREERRRYAKEYRVKRIIKEVNGGS